MVLEVAETITSMLSNSSGFETNIGTCGKILKVPKIFRIF